jgi:hypothetical protein
VLLCGVTIALMAWSARSIYLSYSFALLLLGAGYWCFGSTATGGSVLRSL